MQVKYRKKPLTVTAEQVLFAHQLPEGVKRWPTDAQPQDGSVGYIDTREGREHVWLHDYIVTGTEGEKYPVKEAVFEQIYELSGA